MEILYLILAFLAGAIVGIIYTNRKAKAKIIERQALVYKTISKKNEELMAMKRELHKEKESHDRTTVYQLSLERKEKESLEISTNAAEEHSKTKAKAMKLDKDLNVANKKVNELLSTNEVIMKANKAGNKMLEGRENQIEKLKADLEFIKEERIELGKEIEAIKKALEKEEPSTKKIVKTVKENIASIDGDKPITKKIVVTSKKKKRGHHKKETPVTE